MSRGRYPVDARGAPTWFEVVVGDIGSVYRGADEAEAESLFKIYAALSAEGASRAGDQSVVLLRDGDVERSFVGAADVVQAWRESGMSRTQARAEARFGDWSDLSPAYKRRLIELVESVDSW